MAETRGQAWERLNKELAIVKDDIQLSKATYKGMTLKGLVITMHMVNGDTMQVQPYRFAMVTEKELATALGCSAARVHHACLRSPRFRYTKVRKLWDLEGCLVSECRHDRIHYQGEVYNPVWLFDDVLKDLATRRPYLLTAKEALAA